MVASGALSNQNEASVDSYLLFRRMHMSLADRSSYSSLIDFLAAAELLTGKVVSFDSGGESLKTHQLACAIHAIRLTSGGLSLQSHSHSLVECNEDYLQI